jgi:hypothetical protein
MWPHLVDLLQDRQVRQDLDHQIVPLTNDTYLVAPNFFLEVKGTDVVSDGAMIGKVGWSCALTGSQFGRQFGLNFSPGFLGGKGSWEKDPRRKWFLGETAS